MWYGNTCCLAMSTREDVAGLNSNQFGDKKTVICNQ